MSGLKIGGHYITRSLAYERLIAPLDPLFIAEAKDLIFNEVDFVQALQQLKKITQENTDEMVMQEIESRLYLMMHLHFYYLALLADPSKVLAIASSFRQDNMAALDKSDKSRAIELLDTLLTDRKLAKTVEVVLEAETASSSKQSHIDTASLPDKWLASFIQASIGGDMKDFYRIAKLRKIKLFTALPVETLQFIAESIEVRDAVKGDVIFKQGDEGDGLYMIVSGEFTVEKDGKKIVDLKEGAYFGELALIDNAPRAAGIVTASDGVLFYLDKNIFVRLCDDIPEILRELIRHMLSYIR